LNANCSFVLASRYADCFAAHCCQDLLRKSQSNAVSCLKIKTPVREALGSVFRCLLLLWQCLGGATMAMISLLFRGVLVHRFNSCRAWPLCLSSMLLSAFLSLRTLFGISSRLGRGKNTQAVKSGSIEVSAKASAHVLRLQNQFGHLQGLLPARSAGNGISWLWGVIIAMCTNSAIERIAVLLM